MKAGSVLAALVCSALPLAAAAWIFRRVRRERHVDTRVALAVATAGVGTGALGFFAERSFFGWTGLSIEVTPGAGASALVALALFASPLEEALKALVLAPLVVARRIDGPGLGTLYAVLAAAGFAAAETALFVGTAELGVLPIVRALAGLPAHFFCAGLWGYALGERIRSDARWFWPAWVAAVVVHALYDHIVFGRGPGMLAVALPMLGGMALIAYSAFRDIAPRNPDDHPSSLLPEPPSLRAMRRALQRSDRPIVLRWVIGGAFVNVGAVIVCVGVAVFLAHRLGLDLSLADEADMRSNGPLALLGAAVLAAFPLAGYLVARASGATSVLEPAFAASLAIFGTVAALSVTAPTAVVFALAVAPVAFGLACGGAWFGMDV